VTQPASAGALLFRYKILNVWPHISDHIVYVRKEHTMDEQDWFRVGNSATAIAALAEEARKDPTKGPLAKIMIEQHLHSITLNLQEIK
jgi:hypothetical protein